MAILKNIPIASTVGIFWDKQKKTGVVDVSELRTEDGSRSIDIFTRIYDDACDAGFKVINPASGNITLWVEMKSITNDEGEWQFSTFVCQSLPGWKLRVYND